MTADRLERLAWLLASATILIALGTILAVPILPGQDVPPHTIAALVLSDPSHFAAFFEVNWALTAQLFEAMAVALLVVLPLYWAAKVAFFISAAALITSCGVLAKRTGASPALALSLAASFSIGWLFAMGFVNFFSGLAFGTVGVAILAVARPSLGLRLLTSGVFLTAAFGHIVAAGLMGLFSLVVRAVVTPKETRLREYGLDILTWAPAGTLTLIQMFGTISADTASGRRDVVADMEMPSGIPFMLEGAFGGFSSVGWLIPVALVCGLLAVEKSRRTAVVVAALAGFLLLMMAVPLHAIGWHFAKPRPLFLPTVALPLLLIFEGTRGRVVGASIAAVCLVVTCLNSAGAIREAGRIAEWVQNYEHSDGVLGPAGFPSSGRTFEANFHPEPMGPTGPGIESAIGLPHYATQNGGASPGAFATNPSMHSLSFPGGADRFFPATPLLAMIVREGCRSDDSCWRNDEFRADVLATMAVHWDSVALVDPPDGVLARLAARQMRQLTPWLWAPDVADLRGELPAGFRGPIAWQLGYLETVGVISSGAANITEDAMILRVTDIPGGPTFLRVHRDPNQDGAFQEGEEVIFQQSVELAAGEPTHVPLGR